jgi:hypothetical protein
MGFCAFHFDKTFCADGFPTTSRTVYIRRVKLLSTLSIQTEFGGKGFVGEGTRKQTGHSIAPR